MLPREAILEFQKLYEEIYNEKLSFEQAEVQAGRVFFAIKSTYIPLKKTWLEKLKEKEVKK